MILVRLVGVLIVFGVLSCNNHKTKNAEISQNIDSVANKAGLAIKKNVNFDYNAGNEIVYDTFIVISRQETPYNGKIIRKSEWSDRGGLNRFILASAYDYKNGFGRAEIFAYQYIKIDKDWSLIWRMNDFVDGMGCDLQIDILDLQMTDIDKNGKAEVMMMYTLDGRCDASGVETKLIFIENGKKILIRGISCQYLMPPESIFNKVMDLTEGEYYKYKRIDAGVYSLDTIFVKYASDFWDDFIKKENKQYEKEMEAFRKRQKEELFEKNRKKGLKSKNKTSN